jgi:hypothetical protein
MIAAKARALSQTTTRQAAQASDVDLGQIGKASALLQYPSDLPDSSPLPNHASLIIFQFLPYLEFRIPGKTALNQHFVRNRLIAVDYRPLGPAAGVTQGRSRWQK